MTLRDDEPTLALATPDDLLAILVDLTEDRERRELLRAHDELRDRSAVEQLADEVVRLVRVDLHQAERLATKRSA